MRILLDTMIFRYLAWKDYKQISEEDIAEMIKLGQQRNFWCSPLTIFELGRRLGEGERDFDKFREAFLWMDRLSTRTADLFEDILVGALTRNPRRTPRAELEHLNGLRRLVANSISPQDLRTRGFNAKDVFSYIERAQIEYAKRGAHINEFVANLKDGDFDTPDGAETPIERSRKIDGAIRENVSPWVLDFCRYLAFDGTLHSFGMYNDAEAAKNLRELVHWHIGIIKVAIRNDYNWKKHATDTIDQWLLVYPAGGFIVATSDKSLLARVGDGGCSNPRIMTLKDALKAAQDDAKNES